MKNGVQTYSYLEGYIDNVRSNQQLGYLLEQDLIVQRTIVELFSDPFLNENLVFRKINMEQLRMSGRIFERDEF